MTARELTIKGVSASLGLAAGPLVVLAPQPRRSAENAGTPEQESARLGEAIEAAIGDLAIILEQTEDEAASGMLEFQIAMLADDSLSGPAYRDIANDRSAAKAWGASLDTEIADYQSAEDVYFRARASDLEDLRDRVFQHLFGGQECTVPAGSIVLAEELTPSRFLENRTRIAGIALHRGSSSSHVAILARAQGTPMLIRLGPGNPEPGSEALLDATAGELTVNPDVRRRERFRVREVQARREREAERLHLHEDAVLPGGERVQVLVNVANPHELAELDPSTCDGIGLVRTEFLFDERRSGLPGEEEQFQIYRRVLDWAAGRPVTFRTLDAGADKPISGLTLDGESNPFLGVRGLRLSLRRPDVFKTQLRALIRAAVERGPLKVMLPMVTEPSELDQARELIRAVSAELAEEGIDLPALEVGIMVEVPACALCVDHFDAAFFSIGSNDLLQYLTACGRDSGELEYLIRPDNPALLEMIRRVVEHGCDSGKSVSLCGDMAGDRRYLAKLLDLGLRTVSVAPGALASTKATIAGHGVSRHG